MPSASLTDAIKEAYVLVPSDIAILETLEFIHPSITTIRICKDRVDHDFTLEDMSVETFEGRSFDFKLPSSNDTGLKELGLIVDNMDHVISDTIDSVKGSTTPLKVKYRAYLEDDLTTPQNNPPIILEVRNMNLDGPLCSIVAKFVDFTNKKFLTIMYTRDRFPSLGD